VAWSLGRFANPALEVVGVKFCHSVREEQRLRVFEKRVLRTAFEPKKEEVARVGPPTTGLGPGGEIFSGTAPTG